MPPSRKKAIVRLHDRTCAMGYLEPSGFVREGNIEMLDLAGKVLSLPLLQAKWVCFVRDFNSGEPLNPERLLHTSFSGRPRQAGLWLRLRLRNGELLEGVAANDATLLDPDGVFLTPPDTRSNTQRIFLPRLAIAELEVVSVIGGTAAAGRRKPPQGELARAQQALFDRTGSDS
jgi:hypothetical protein